MLSRTPLDLYTASHRFRRVRTTCSPVCDAFEFQTHRGSRSVLVLANDIFRPLSLVRPSAPQGMLGWFSTRATFSVCRRFSACNRYKVLVFERQTLLPPPRSPSSHQCHGFSHCQVVKRAPWNGPRQRQGKAVVMGGADRSVTRSIYTFGHETDCWTVAETARVQGDIAETVWWSGEDKLRYQRLRSTTGWLNGWLGCCVEWMNESTSRIFEW